MKKIMAVLLMVVSLCSCAVKNYTPVVNTDFDLRAVYKAGDFSYNCRVVKKGGVVTVTALDTKAKGMTITYDAKTVTFQYDNMTKSFDKDSIDSSNPAIVFYDVFSSVEKTGKENVRVISDGFVYFGKTSLGEFELVQNQDNSYRSITLKDAEISITFI